MMPDTLRLKMAWQQQFLDDDWVLESYSTEDSMPKACEQGAGRSARLCNADRHAILSWTTHLSCEQCKDGRRTLAVLKNRYHDDVCHFQSVHFVHTAVLVL